MELTNEFRVGVPVEQAWLVLTDVERIAPCMPGAELQEVEGDEYRGIVKVKVGPITAQYKGRASFIEQDEPGRRLVLRAEGRDTRGQGNANATVTATLVADGAGTTVTVVTDLNVTGRVAQFGRGVLADVSAKLLTQFVSCLEDDVLSSVPAAGSESAAGTATEGEGSAEPAPASAAAPAATTSAATTGASAEASPSPEAAGATTTTSNGAGRATGTAAPTSAGTDSGPRKIESRPAQPVDLLDAAGGSVAKRIGPAIGALVFLIWVFRRRKKR